MIKSRNVVVCAGFLAAIFQCSGCAFMHNDESKAEPGEAPTGFADTMKKLSTDAAMGTDDDLKAYVKNNHLCAHFIAPKGLRPFLLTSEIVQKKNTEYQGFLLGFSCDKGRISLTWSGRFEILGDKSEATRILLSTIKRTGLAASEGKPWTFTRKIGNATEELVVGFSQNEGGKRVACRGNYQWRVTCDYAGMPPTLSALLKAMPSLQPLYREDALFDRLKDEPAFAFSTSLAAR